MLTLVLLPLLVGLASSRPQTRIIPEANTYGTQASVPFHSAACLPLGRVAAQLIRPVGGGEVRGAFTSGGGEFL